jgi:hypothetical protein
MLYLLAGTPASVQPTQAAFFSPVPDSASTPVQSGLARFVVLDITRLLTSGMLRELPDMPTGVVGFEVSGTVRAEDYRDIVIPALERAASEGDVRFIVEMPGSIGMTPSAMWQDLKVAVEYLRAIRRLAVVTDIEWVPQMMALFGWLMPIEARTFSLAQRDDALQWIAS